MSEKDHYKDYEERKQRLMDEKTLAPYEKKAEKFERQERQERKTSGSGRALPDEQNMRYLPLQFKKGGTASSRADGCAVKGKTKGKIV